MIYLTNELVTQEDRYVRMSGFGRGRTLRLYTRMGDACTIVVFVGVHGCLIVVCRKCLREASILQPWPLRPRVS